jgi:hypothetical protein
LRECSGFVRFDNATANPVFVAMSRELIDASDMSDSEKTRLRLWLISQRRMEAMVAPVAAPLLLAAPIVPVAVPAAPIVPVAVPAAPIVPAAAPAVSFALSAAMDDDFPELFDLGSGSSSLSSAASTRRRLDFERMELEALRDSFSVRLPATQWGTIDSIFDESLWGAAAGAGPSSTRAAGAGPSSTRDDDDCISRYLSKLSTKEESAGGSLHGAAMTIYEDDAADDVIITGVSLGTPIKPGGTLRRSRVSFANSPPRVIGSSAGDDRAASVVIVIEASPPHKKTKPVDE